MLDLCKNRKISVPYCINLFDCWAVIFIVMGQRGHQKTSWKLIYRLFLSLRVTRHRKFSVLASSRVFGKLSIGKSVTTYSVSFILRHRKLFEPWSNPVFQPKLICYILFIFVRVLFIDFCRLTSHRDFIHFSLSRTDGTRWDSKASANFFCMPLLHFWCLSMLCFWEFRCSPTAEWILKISAIKISAHICFPMWRRFSSFIYFSLWFVEGLHNRWHL